MGTGPETRNARPTRKNTRKVPAAMAAPRRMASFIPDLTINV